MRGMNENNMRNAVILRAVIMSIFAAVGLYAAYFAVRFSGILFIVCCVVLSSVLGFFLYISGNGLRAVVYAFWGFFLLIIILSLSFSDIFFLINPIVLGDRLSGSLFWSVFMCAFYSFALFILTELVCGILFLVNKGK